MVTMIRHLQHDGRRASFEVLTGYDIEEHAPTYQAYHTGKEAAAVYSDGMTGVTLHGIEHGVNDYIYARSGIPGQYRYHRRRVYYAARPYFMIDGRRVHLDECIRI